MTLFGYVQNILNGEEETTQRRVPDYSHLPDRERIEEELEWYINKAPRLDRPKRKANYTCLRKTSPELFEGIERSIEDSKSMKNGQTVLTTHVHRDQKQIRKKVENPQYGSHHYGKSLKVLYSTRKIDRGRGGSIGSASWQLAPDKSIENVNETFEELDIMKDVLEENPLEQY